MTARRVQHRRPRGVSLVEALVALAVMAFGMLGVVGIQATLRSNADTSRQRGEAVRLAQQALEDARSFDTLSGAGRTYGAIVSTAAEAIADPDATHAYSTTYSRQSTVVPLAAAAAAPAGAGVPQAKVLSVVVSWADRASQPQQVRIVSNIAGVAPELAGSLGLSGDGAAAVRQPFGRNRAIPPSASNEPGTGTSTFTPPGSTGLTWVFNNTTGVITSISCPNSVCTASNALLLSGYVRFALGPGAQSASPTSDVPAAVTTVGVVVATTVPTAPATACFARTSATYVTYYCAVPISTTSPGPFVWSGTSRVVLTGGVISTALTDAVAEHFKVCRYTPGRDVDSDGDGNADGDVPLRRNVDHPRVYANVDRPLANQNFLVISAGDDTTPYDCPVDGGVPGVNTNTWRHQPPTP